MAFHPWITGGLLAISALLCLLCGVGVLVMRDAYQRLHFTTPVAAVVTLLLCACVFLEDSSPQARMKSSLVALVLLSMNSILCHLTGRAIRLRDVEHWPIEPGEPIKINGQQPAPTEAA